MFHLSLVIEDHTLTTIRMDDSKWHVRIVDAFSSKSAEVVWSDVEIASVLFLALANDPQFPMTETGKRLIAAIRTTYEIATPLFEKLDPSLRCIP